MVQTLLWTVPSLNPISVYVNTDRLCGSFHFVSCGKSNVRISCRTV